MKHKSIQPKWIVIVPILIFMFICTLNTCYEWYISNQQNAAMNVMQKLWINITTMQLNLSQ